MIKKIVVNFMKKNSTNNSPFLEKNLAAKVGGPSNKYYFQGKVPKLEI